MTISSSNTTTFTVRGMTCSHCVDAVTRELSKLEGVNRVEVDLVTGLVTVGASQPVDPGATAAAVVEAGYEVVSEVDS